MNFINNLKIINKIMLPIIIGFALIVLFQFLFVLPKIEQSLYEEKNLFIENVVQSSVSLIEYYEKEFTSGNITEEDFYSKVEEIVRNTRFEGDNYIFITDYEKMLYHGVNPALEGRTLELFKDVKEDLFLVRIADILKNQDDTFIDYYWSKPNVDGQFHKIAYARKTAEVEMLVVGGIYVDDIEKRLAAITSEITIAFLAIIALLLIVLSLIIIFTIVKPMKRIAALTNQVADGDLNIKDVYQSKDEIGIVANSVKKMIDTLQELLAETEELTNSAADGKLDVRGRSSKFQGSYSELVSGINRTLDAIIAPLNVAAEYIDRISKGDLPPKISDHYRGDFNEIKNNINQCIDSINLLVNDSKQLSGAAIEGKLNFRAEEFKHNGEFRNIISGVNATMERLVGLIENMPIPAQIVDKDYKITFINKAAKELKRN